MLARRGGPSGPLRGLEYSRQVQSCEGGGQGGGKQRCTLQIEVHFVGLAVPCGQSCRVDGDQAFYAGFCRSDGHFPDGIFGRKGGRYEQNQFGAVPLTQRAKVLQPGIRGSLKLLWAGRKAILFPANRDLGRTCGIKHQALAAPHGETRVDTPPIRREHS